MFNVILLILLIYITISKFKIKENFKYKNKISECHIINLDKDKLRWNYVIKQLKNLNFPIKRFKAINGFELTKKQIQKTKLINIDIKKLDEKSMGSLGCALSHITLWKKLFNSKNDNFMILEDDVIVKEDLNSKLLIYMKKVPKDWDIIFLGGSRIEGKKINNNVLVPNNLQIWNNCGLFAYIVNKKGLKKLINLSVNLDTYLDFYLNQFYGNKIKAYYLIPMLIEHNFEIPSTRINNKLYKKSFEFYAKKIKIN